MVSYLKYRLYKTSDNNIYGNVKETFFKNRNVDDYEKYINLDDSCVIPYIYLNNIQMGIECFDKHFQINNPISILVDEDVDGFCSAAMMYQYIKRLSQEYPVSYILHGRAKSHGLSGDIKIPEDTKLLIIPDAGTNDIEQCKLLKEQGIDIIVLDHHEQEEVNPYAIIINNQCSKEYSNKSFCGAGIVYKFLQGLDEFYWNDYADVFLDLCALANISDVMDIRSYETKYIIDKGLKNIHNQCFSALINAQSYSMAGVVNIHNVQWYITPIINGCIRFGSSEEKELLFRAFIEQNEFFDYKKRAKKGEKAEVVKESIYDRAARLCKNAKGRQDKTRDKCVETVINNLHEKENADNKIIIYDATGEVDTSLTGLVAIKVADIFHKPCILLQKHIVTDKNGIQHITFGGSARNINNSPIDNLKDIINQASSFNWAKGHANAFGVNLPEDKINQAREQLNAMLVDIKYDSTYVCDFILDIEDISVLFLSELSELKNFFGQGINEPEIAVENIRLKSSDFEVLGKKADTIKFKYNDVEFVQFRCKKDNPILMWLNNSWDDDKAIRFNIVGKPGINIFNNIKTLQVVIDDIEICDEDILNNCEVDELWDDDEDIVW